ETLEKGSGVSIFVDSHNRIEARNRRSGHIQSIIRSPCEVIGRNGRLKMRPDFLLADLIYFEDRSGAISDVHLSVFVESDRGRICNVARKLGEIAVDIDAKQGHRQLFASRAGASDEKRSI